MIKPILSPKCKHDDQAPKDIFQRYRKRIEPLQKLLEDAETHKNYHKFTDLEDLALSILTSLQEEDLFRKFTTKRFCDNPEPESSQADLESFKREINQKHKNDIDELFHKYEAEKDKLRLEKDDEIAALEQKIETLRREKEAQSKDQEMEENAPTDAHLPKKLAMKREAKFIEKEAASDKPKIAKEVKAPKPVVTPCFERPKLKSYSNEEFDVIWKEVTNKDIILALSSALQIEMNNIIYVQFFTKLEKRIPNLKRFIITHIPDNHEETRNALTAYFPDEVKEFDFHHRSNACSFDYFFPSLITVAP